MNEPNNVVVDLHPKKVKTKSGPAQIVAGLALLVALLLSAPFLVGMCWRLFKMGAGW